VSDADTKQHPSPGQRPCGRCAAGWTPGGCSGAAGTPGRIFLRRPNSKRFLTGSARAGHSTSISVSNKVPLGFAVTGILAAELLERGSLLPATLSLPLSASGPVEVGWKRRAYRSLQPTGVWRGLARQG
jgi:hypothetical protein